MTARALLCAALLALVPAACAVPEAEPARTGPARPANALESELVETLETMTRALEREDVFACMEHVSERFVPSKLSLKVELDDGLASFLGYGFHTLVTRCHVEGTEGTLIVEWRRGRSHRETGVYDSADGVTELKFTREDGAWLLVQQNGDALLGK